MNQLQPLPHLVVIHLVVEELELVGRPLVQVHLPAGLQAEQEIRRYSIGAVGLLMVMSISLVTFQITASGGSIWTYNNRLFILNRNHRSVSMTFCDDRDGHSGTQRCGGRVQSVNTNS